MEQYNKYMRFISSLLNTYIILLLIEVVMLTVFIFCEKNYGLDKKFADVMYLPIYTLSILVIVIPIIRFIGYKLNPERKLRLHNDKKIKK